MLVLKNLYFLLGGLTCCVIFGRCLYAFGARWGMYFGGGAFDQVQFCKVTLFLLPCEN